MVAYDILAELESPNGLQTTTLKRLAKEWIAVNLKPKLSLRTLKVGLAWAYQWHTAGRPKQSVFAELNGKLSERSLRDYIRWYEAIEDLAQDKERFAEFLPPQGDQMC